MTTQDQHKVVIVTGGASGIGAAACRLLAGHGFRLVVADVQEQAGLEVAADTGGLFIRHDVSSAQSWQAMLAETVQKCGPVFGLVAAAGIKSNYGVESTPDAALLERTMAVNQMGILLGIQILGAHMREHGGGSIVNIASATGMPPAVSQDIAYVGTKWAVRGISRTAARKLAPDGVRVNCILPGLVETPMIAGSMQADPAQVERALAQIPMRRVGRPIEIAHAVHFFLSDLSSYATGAELVIDGGLVA